MDEWLAATTVDGEPTITLFPSSDNTVPGIWTSGTEQVLLFDIPKREVTFFDEDGETVLDAQKIWNGATFSYQGETPTKAADAAYTYAFGGWDPAVAFPATAVCDTNFVAVYARTPIDYAISYDLAGGALAEGALNPETYNVEKPTFTLANPSREGHAFAGWVEAGAPAATNLAVTVENGSTGDLSFVAAWTVNSYTVSFDCDGGNQIPDLVVPYGSPIVVPETPKKIDYMFVGWEPKLPATMPAENLSVKAKWELQKEVDVEYTARHWQQNVGLDGYTLVDEVDAILVRTGLGDTQTEAQAHEYAGFALVPFSQVNISADPDRPTVVDIHYDRELYATTWIVEGVTTTTQTAFGAAPVYGPADPVKTDATGKYAYAFTGWEPALAAAATGPATYTATFDRTLEIPLALALADPTLHAAEATAPGYLAGTVAAVLRGLDADLAVSLESSTSPTAAATAVAEGAAVSMAVSPLVWNEGYDWSLSATMGEESAVLPGRFYAKGSTNWMEKPAAASQPIAESDLHAYLAAASSPAAEAVRVHTKMTLDAVPLVAAPDVGDAVAAIAVLQLPGDDAGAYYGYDGASWTKLLGAAPAFGEEIDLLADVDLAAAAPAIRYYVDGVALHTEAGAYAIPVKAGTDSLRGFAVLNPDAVSAPIVAVADSPFVAAVGETPYGVLEDAVDALPHDGSAALSLLASDLAPTNFPIALGLGERIKIDTARGSLAEGVEVATTDVVGHEVKVTTEGTVATYAVETLVPTIFFDTDGGTEIAPLSFAYGAAVVPPDPPTKEGHTFAGWLPELPGTMGAEDVTVVAQWTINTYSVEWRNWDGTVLKTLAAVEWNTAPAYDGAAPTRPATATKIYAFRGWTPAEGAVLGDTVYTADYEEIAAVARIDETPYAHLYEALAAAQDGDTVTMLADYALSRAISLETSATVTVDLAGRHVDADAVRGVVLTGGGTFILSDSSEEETGLWSTTGSAEGEGAIAAIVVAGEGTAFRMESGSLRGKRVALAAQNGASVAVSGGVVYVAGASETEDVSTVAIALNNASATLTGGVVSNANPIVESNIPAGIGHTTAGATATVAVSGTAVVRSVAGCGVRLGHGDALTMTGGDVAGARYGIRDTTTEAEGTAATFALSGGRVAGGLGAVLSEAAGFIAGGFYKPAADAAHVAAGRKSLSTADEDGYYEVVAAHEVSFAHDGSSAAIPAQTVAHGETAEAPAAPEKEGYAFAAWLDGAGAAWDFEAPVTADLALTAKWDLVVEVEGYDAIYDGAAHGVAVTAPAAATVLYATSAEGPFAAEAPAWTAAGTNTVWVRVEQTGCDSVERSAAVAIAFKAATVAADPATKTYGEADPAFTATVTGLVDGDALAYDFTREDGEDVGTYALTPAGEAVQGSYTVTYEDSTLTIEPLAVVIRIAGAADSAVYNGAEQTLSGYTATSGTDGFSPDAALVAFSGTGLAAGTDVGTYPMGLDASQFSYRAGNFKVVFEVEDGALTIEPAPVVVAAQDASKIAGNPDPEFTATVTGLVGTDTVSYTVTRAAGEEPGTYAITAAGDAVQGNYAVTYTGATFTIAGAAARIGTVYYETLSGALAAAVSGDTVELLADATQGAFALDGDVVLDLGGHTLALTGVMTQRAGAVEIRNGTIETSVTDVLDVSGAGATLTLGEDLAIDAHSSVVYAQNGATVEIAGAAISTDGGYVPIYGDGGSHVVVKDGSVYSKNTSAIGVEPGSIEITGGTVTSDAASTYAAVYVIGTSSTLSITGGTVEGAWEAVQVTQGTATIGGDAVIEGGSIAVNVGFKGGTGSAAITGGTVTGVIGVNGGSLAVSGGSFDRVVPEGFCAEGYIPVTTPDLAGRYTVKRGAYVAKIAEIGYETIDEAFAAYEEGDVLTMLATNKITASYAIGVGETFKVVNKATWTDPETGKAKTVTHAVSAVMADTVPAATAEGGYRLHRFRRQDVQLGTLRFRRQGVRDRRRGRLLRFSAGGAGRNEGQDRRGRHDDRGRDPHEERQRVQRRHARPCGPHDRPRVLLRGGRGAVDRWSDLHGEGQRRRRQDHGGQQRGGQGRQRVQSGRRVRPRRRKRRV